MKRVLIIDHFSQTPDEPGNNRFIYLAEMLAEYGYEVEIVTTTFAHKMKQTRVVDPSIFEGLPYRYTMLDEPGYPKNVCLRRFYSHFVFGRNLVKYLDSIEKPDLVYVAIPSLDVGYAAANYCRKYNIPFIVDIQDLWPEAFKLVFHVPVLSDMIFAPMVSEANRAYRQADRIVAVSETYKERGLSVNSKDKEGLCIYLGTDLECFDQSAQSIPVQKQEDELWVAYVGTLGTSYNIEIILDALNQLDVVLLRNVVFKVMGDGPYLDRFKKYASENCKAKVEFLGRLDYPEMVSILQHSDIAVNPIVKGAAQSIINKHADYAAAGLPVVSTQECEEYQKLLERYRCGVTCGVESVDEVAKALEDLIRNGEKRKKLGAASRRMAEENFDRNYTYRKIVRTIDELVKKK